MGRNREPIKLLQAKGRKHLTKAEIQDRLSAEIPVVVDHVEAPGFLSKTEKEKFNKIAGELIRLEIFSNLDCDVLGRYIRSEGEWVRYGRLVKKTQSNLNRALSAGDAAQTAFYTDMLCKYEGMRSKAFSQCHTCASALGLTITSRCRLVVPHKDDTSKENKYTEFIV